MELEDTDNGRYLRLRLPVAAGSLIIAVLLSTSGTLWALSLAGAEQKIINAITGRRLDKIESRWEEVSRSLVAIAATQSALVATQTQILARLSAGGGAR